MLRKWLYSFESEAPEKEAKFEKTGQWENGSFAYSMLDKDGNIIPEYDGAFYQIRLNGKLVMVHV